MEEIRETREEKTEEKEPLREEEFEDPGFEREDYSSMPDERDFTIRSLILENEALKRKESERILEEDLLKVRKLDPHIRKIEDLGEVFITLRAGGIPCEEAYKAASSLGLKKTIPQMGDVFAGSEEKEFFTPEEVKNMTNSQVKKNYEKIRKSMSKWKA